MMSPDPEELISRNLMEFLRANLKEGQEAEVAIHPELRRVLVFVDDELVLTCGFEPCGRSDRDHVYPRRGRAHA